jgi:TetR/AcrR family transcriptional repressor of nem operon
MPWEKTFDEAEALEKSMKLFWEKGYVATSITNLIETTGVNRGSLYNAFGGKHELFVQSLLKYDAEFRRSTLAELEAMNNPVEAIRVLFDAIVRETVEDTEKKGCFLINTALELESHDDKTLSIVKQGLEDFEAFFRRCLEVAQARREAPASLNPGITAKMLLSLVVAMRVLGRGAYKEPALMQISQEAQRLISRE